LGVTVAKAAHAAERCHALFEADEAAIAAATHFAAIVRAPRIVLRLGCAAAADACHGNYSEHQEHMLHCCLLVWCWLRWHLLQIPAIVIAAQTVKT
jgi:hypothetical protein